VVDSNLHPIFHGILKQMIPAVIPKTPESQKMVTLESPEMTLVIHEELASRLSKETLQKMNLTRKE
jgi:hypothetical protein